MLLSSPPSLKLVDQDTTVTGTSNKAVSLELGDYPIDDQIALLLALLGHQLGGVLLINHDPRLVEQWTSLVQQLRQAAGFDVKHFDGQVPRVPVNCGLQQLLGGADMVATLLQSRQVISRGIICRADQSFVVLPLAELHSKDTIRAICGALDSGTVGNNPARVCVFALSPQVSDIDAALIDRLAFCVSLNHDSDSVFIDLDDAADKVAHTLLDPQMIAPLLQHAAKCLKNVRLTDEALEKICSLAPALGIASMRAQIRCATVARCVAALAARDEVADADVDLAMSLCFAWRATSLPSAEKTTEDDNTSDDSSDSESDNKPDTENQSETDQSETESLESPASDLPPQMPSASADKTQDDPASAQSNLPDQIDTVSALLPEQLLNTLTANQTGLSQQGQSLGRSGQRIQSTHRGRLVGTQRYRSGSGHKINFMATLREAAVWQKQRRTQRDIGADSKRPIIYPQDIRASRYKQATQTVTIFVVDASGSAAARRLAEAKGAVELLLAECYVRRDQVALIVFQGPRATLVLPPTRSLVKARRELSQLPAGGGTPLAAAIDLAKNLAMDISRAGNTPLLCLLTDGRANVDRDGIGGRTRALQHALQAAQAIRTIAMQSLVIDISARASVMAGQLADAMGGQHLALPRADAKRITRAVSDKQRDTKRQGAA